MKKQWMLVCMMVCMVLTVGSAMAQNGPGMGALTTKVPFEFFAGDARLPAGSYTIKRLNEIDPTILEIASSDGKMSALVTVQAGSGPDYGKTTELVFNKYGSRFFLSGISIQGANLSSQLSKSRFETLVGKGEAPGEGRHVPAVRKTPPAKK